MERALRIAAAAALGLSLAQLAPAGPAAAQDGVTVGGWIEVIGGTSENDGGVDGISRGIFSRFSVSYDTVLDNGLTVAGRAAFQLNQRGSGATINVAGPLATASGTRMDAATNFAPDVLYISVGGGFGTVSVGAHAPATCSLMPRPIAFVNGVNSTHYSLFSGVAATNGTFSESNYCSTPESVSYATPNINGFSAMFTYAPDNESNQGTSLTNAQNPDVQGGANIEDRIDVAAAWSGAMGAMNVALGAGYQSGANDALDSLTFAGTVGVGGFTFGASWFDNDAGPASYTEATLLAEAVEERNESGVNEWRTETEAALSGGGQAWQSDQNGWTIAGKYDIGALTLGVTYSSADRDNHAFARGVAVEGVGGADPTSFANIVTQTGGLVSDVEETALVLGASYAIGGGLTAWIEYMDLEQEYNGSNRVITTTTTSGFDAVTTAASREISTMTTNDDSLFLVGVTLGF